MDNPKKLDCDDRFPHQYYKFVKQQNRATNYMVAPRENKKYKRECANTLSGLIAISGDEYVLYSSL